MERITKKMAAAMMPPRRSDGHKGTFGKVCVIGGSVGYTGAPVYAAEAATRMGSGLVFLGTPGEVYPIVAGRCDSAMAFPLPEDREGLAEQLNGYDAVLVGPGLGAEKERRALVRFLLKELTCPVVLDADGINAVAAHRYVLEERTAPTVVTPHQGEFLRLGGNLARGREIGAEELAKALNCTVVLKGPGTIVASKTGTLWQNTTGSSALAKGGSGDVLAGVILSLVGQDCDVFAASALGVWVHGRAGDRLEERLTAYGLAPSDLVRELPLVIKELLE